MSGRAGARSGVAFAGRDCEAHDARRREPAAKSRMGGRRAAQRGAEAIMRMGPDRGGGRGRRGRLPRLLPRILPRKADDVSLDRRAGVGGVGRPEDRPEKALQQHRVEREDQ